jgi:ADP-heptose:LPS heptosyltransferase
MRESLVIRSLPLDLAVDAVFSMADDWLGREFDVLDYGENAPVWHEVARQLGRTIHVRARQRRLPLIGPWDLPASERYGAAFVLGTGPRAGLDQVMALARAVSDQPGYFDVGTSTLHSIGDVTDVERIDTESRFLPSPASATTIPKIDLRVIRVDLLGDLIFTVPLLRLLREFFPTKTLSLVVDKRYEEFAGLIRGVDQVEAIAMENHAQFSADLSRCASTAAEWQILPIGGGWRPDLASRIHRTLPASRRLSRLNIDTNDLHVVNASRRQEVVEVASLAMMLRYPAAFAHGRETARMAGVIDAVRQYMRPLPLEQLFKIDAPTAFIGKLGINENDLLFAPLGGSAERDWTISGWQEAASFALSTIPGRLILIGNNTDRHREFNGRLASAVASDRLVNLTGQTSLKDLLQIASRCGGYVGTNTAPMHLVALQGKRMVALNSPFEAADFWRYPFDNQELLAGRRLLQSAHQQDLASCIERIWKRCSAPETEDYFYDPSDVASALSAVFPKPLAAQRQAS